MGAVVVSEVQVYYPERVQSFGLRPTPYSLPWSIRGDGGEVTMEHKTPCASLPRTPLALALIHLLRPPSLAGRQGWGLAATPILQVMGWGNGNTGPQERGKSRKYCAKCAVSQLEGSLWMFCSREVLGPLCCTPGPLHGHFQNLFLFFLLPLSCDSWKEVFREGLRSKKWTSEELVLRTVRL